MAYGRVEIYAHALISAIEVSGQLEVPSDSLPLLPWIGDWKGPKADPDPDSVA
jgi:hypothetical protein